jgi:hypothetical protein
MYDFVKYIAKRNSQPAFPGAAVSLKCNGQYWEYSEQSQRTGRKLFRFKTSISAQRRKTAI